ncbi:MAG: DUF4169 family protein [Rhodobacteraceae bacterium]|jgi:hypothetical protein|nr:DUF4169 family protein [Paracoccaceae bacterium]
MAGVVNLNRFRKEKARAERRAEAEANAAKHGRTRAERSLDQARVEKSTRDLEAHRRDEPDESG